MKKNLFSRLKSMKHVIFSTVIRTLFWACIVISILFIGVLIDLSINGPHYVIYEVNKDGWTEVYRSIDAGRSRSKYWELSNNNPENKVYIYIDEEYSTSIIPF